MNRRLAVLGAAVFLLLLLWAADARAQVEMEARPPVPQAEVVPPGAHYETTRPSDADYYPPPGPRVKHDPAFIEPLAGKYQTPTGSGRVGLSGWTAPNTPVGSPQTGHREVAGWFALGFSVTWDGPPPVARRPVSR